MLERERGRAGGRLLKFLFVLIGFSAMASLEAAGGHSHGHGPVNGSSGGHGHSHGNGHNHATIHLPSTTTAAAITGGFHDHDHHDHDHGHHDHGHHDHDH